jgi:hypothetical protein
MNISKVDEIFEKLIHGENSTEANDLMLKACEE